MEELREEEGDAAEVRMAARVRVVVRGVYVGAARVVLHIPQER